MFLVGDGAVMCYNKLKDELPNVKLPSAALLSLRASSICAVAEQKDSKSYIAAEKLLPKYLRLPQAQRELKRKQEQESEDNE